MAERRRQHYLVGLAVWLWYAAVALGAWLLLATEVQPALVLADMAVGVAAFVYLATGGHGSEERRG